MTAILSRPQCVNLHPISSWHRISSVSSQISIDLTHNDVIRWNYFPRYWPFVRRIHQSPVNSPHKGQWRGALMFLWSSPWINGWVNNCEAGDLRRHRAHYDVIVMLISYFHIFISYVHVGIYAIFSTRRTFSYLTLFHLYFIWSYLLSLLTRHLILYRRILNYVILSYLISYHRYHLISTSQRKIGVTPLLTLCSYVSFILSYRSHLMILVISYHILSYFISESYQERGTS